MDKLTKYIFTKRFSIIDLFIIGLYSQTAVNHGILSVQAIIAIICLFPASYVTYHIEKKIFKEK